MKLLGGSVAGMHSMVDEHFGIRLQAPYQLVSISIFLLHFNYDTSLFCYLENALDEITLMF